MWVLVPLVTRVPDLQCLVRAAADNVFAVGTECHIPDLVVCVSFEPQDFLPCGGVPERQSVEASADNALAVGTGGRLAGGVSEIMS